MRPIAIFYHCLFFLEGQLLDNGCRIIYEQMRALERSGLLEAAQEFHVGINGWHESEAVANLVIPPKARRILHGPSCKSENRTILALEEWLKTHPDWNVLYFHSKGATHPPHSLYHATVTPWRDKMMKACVENWQQCVADLETFESVGTQWMTGPTMPPGHSIWGGNFWWAQSNFLRILPSIMETDRLKLSGIDALISRYEAEVWIGRGPRLPTVKDYAL